MNRATGWTGKAAALLLVSIASLFAPKASGELVWEKLASDPALPAMTGQGTALYDSKIYVAGRYTYSAETYVFDGNAWTRGPDLPEARRNMQMIVYKGELLAVGGTTPTGNVAGTVWKLNGDRTAWVDHSSSGSYYAVTAPGLAVLGGELYSVGGYRNQPTTEVQLLTNNDTQWVTLTTDPLPAGYSTWQGVVTYHDRLYVTGLSGNQMWSFAGNTTGGNDWRRETDLPVSFSSLISTVVYQDRIFAIGGSTICSWGLGDSSWRLETSLPDSTSVYRGGAVVHNDAIYVVGGSPTGSATGATNNVFIAVPEPNTVGLLLLTGTMAMFFRFRKRG